MATRRGSSMRGSAAAPVLLLAAAICSFFVVLTRGVQLPQPAAGRSRVGASCMPHEMDALLAFKQGVTSDPAGVLASWRRRRGGVHGMDDCCRWRGVRCSNGTGGHVMELRLRNADLYDGRALVGKISRSLLSLGHLEYLDLSMNSLEGSTGGIPEFLGSFKRLKYLNLSGIPFSGGVPTHLGNLSKLQFLDISGTQGTLSLDISWLTGLRHLQYLNFNSVNLSATANWAHVVNMIPSLKFLDLSDCLLASSNQSLPRLNLTNLEWLDLSENYFHHPIASCCMYGQLPEALGTMISLQYLDLSYTTISAPMINLKNLCNLRELNLQSNQMFGVLPDFLQHFTGLVILDLSHNNITGLLPRFLGNFTSLKTLDLSSNNFTGGVPDEIGALTNLTNLYLRNNGLLDGVITEKHFGGLESLQYIDLSYTSLKVEVSSEWQPRFRLRNAQFASCQLGPLFPAWLRWMVDILFLDISGTSINDRIPHWFCNAFSNSVYLNLANNQITGDLPRNMEIMSLERLHLSSNNLTGQISRLPPNLTRLDISMNSVLGPLPVDFGAPKLTELSLFSNRITGPIPKYICKCKGLMTLDLANNLFEGEIPPCFGMTMLTTLELSNNNLSGEFHSFVQNSTNLQFLDLAWNKFSGRLPTWIGDLVGLQFIRLSHNMFSGNIPVSITSLGCLQYLDIADNSISSSLPRNMLNLTAMREKHSTIKYPQQPSYCGFYSVPDEYHSVELSAVTKGQELNYGTSSRILNMKMLSIDLSLNNLSGEIPEEIINLDALVNLNLSHNHFSRNIPHKIGAMRSLESLDLSRNDLSMEIPASMSNLAFLSYLDLSYNNLTGGIPSGPQLDSLYASNPSMYAGNIGLCGPPLIKGCSSNETSIHSHLRTNEAGADFFYLGLGCGFIVGIWMVFCALLFKKRWSVAYFDLLDNSYSK
uniref:Uncharacterized protein n=2 Tax=Setaria viridis TaxID=4556 RepID=A0A4U6TG06_SETVI|nr:hypothetical protein SEVIR_8G166200v2 [Setaria viridis]